MGCLRKCAHPGSFADARDVRRGRCDALVDGGAHCADGVRENRAGGPPRGPDRRHPAGRMGRAGADTSGMAAAAVRRPVVAAEELRARRRALALLAIALVLAMTTWFSATAVIPQLRVEWDLSRTSASWLTIAVQLGFVAGALVSSVLNISDVIPPRLVILVGALGAAAANLALLAATGPGGALPARFATGFFLAGVYPPALKLMATWFRENRGVALGVLVGALTLGSATPHLVNG